MPVSGFDIRCGGRRHGRATTTPGPGQAGCRWATRRCGFHGNAGCAGACTASQFGSGAHARPAAVDSPPRFRGRSSVVTLLAASLLLVVMLALWCPLDWVVPLAPDLVAFIGLMRQHQRESCSSYLSDRVHTDVVRAAAHTPLRAPRSQLIAGRAAETKIDIVSVTADIDRLAVAAATFCVHMDPAALGTFWVIVPDKWFVTTASMFDTNSSTASNAIVGNAAVLGSACINPDTGAWVLPFRVLNESSIIPEYTTTAHFDGYQRQVTLKLAVARIVTSEFYLVLDSDIYARRSFGIGDLLSADRLRAKTNLDAPAHAQPVAWHAESARLLRSELAADTEALCAELPNGALFVANTQRPFDVLTNVSCADFQTAAGLSACKPNAVRRTFHTVYGACFRGRALKTHPTPMLLSRSVVNEVLIPRLEANQDFWPWLAEAKAALHVAAGATLPWYLLLHAYHVRRTRSCVLHPSNRYSWTEYGLYWQAALLASIVDDYHEFDLADASHCAAGGILDIRNSVYNPSQYQHADWDAIFDSTAATVREQQPLVLIHSWMGYPVEDLLRAMYRNTFANAQPGTPRVTGNMRTPPGNSRKASQRAL